MELKKIAGKNYAELLLGRIMMPIERIPKNGRSRGGQFILKGAMSSNSGMVAENCFLLYRFSI